MKLSITLEELDKIQIHFIVAKARTGSTLLLSMLGQHGQILPVSEKPFPYFLHSRYGKIDKWTKHIIERYCADFYLFSKYDLAAQFSSLETLKHVLMQYKKDLTYQRVIRLTAFCFLPEKDKSKVTLIVFKELIMGNYLLEAHKLFPESKFILLYRNPLDNVSRVRSQQQKWGIKNPNIFLEASYWNHHYNLFLQKKLSLPKHTFVDLHYENLIENNEVVLHKLCQFLNIPFDANMQGYYLKAKSKIPGPDKLDSAHKISYENKLKIHDGLTKQPDKQKIDAWKKELNGKDAATIWKICRKTALEIGYEDIKGIATSKRLFLVARFRFFLFYRLFVPLWYKSPLWIKIGFKKFKYKLGLR